jgi:hypothetical protein
VFVGRRQGGMIGETTPFPPCPSTPVSP